MFGNDQFFHEQHRFATRGVWQKIVNEHAYNFLLEFCDQAVKVWRVKFESLLEQDLFRAVKSFEVILKFCQIAHEFEGGGNVSLEPVANNHDITARFMF